MEELRGHLVVGSNPPFLVDLFRNIPKRRVLTGGPPRGGPPAPTGGGPLANMGAPSGAPHIHEGPQPHGAPSGPPVDKGVPSPGAPQVPNGPPPVQGAPSVQGPPSAQGPLALQGAPRVQGAPSVRGPPSAEGAPIAEDFVFFLSHFHADHYGGLTRNWKRGPIWCSSVTGNLVERVLGVPSYFIMRLPIGRRVKIKEIFVTLIDANHCPGKEKIALHLARHCNLRIFISPQRRRVFSCLEFPPEDSALFTEKADEAQVDLVPMNVCGSTFPPRGNFNGIRQHLQTLGLSEATRVVGLKTPTCRLTALYSS
ncbi:DNA cross-link repair protein, putative [Eimeria mitis]|uniref:DNA cross-link repair protein, putative n=1 Tax=Eimeria mitis TaxID=44415 RepID=U6JNT0_9EIME|nr:DNA cross-link repair protein, putative [Eimeria mitis]CDJ27154.1 DNA cross-link repair protein, putative [Eimeria mitis]